MMRWLLIGLFSLGIVQQACAQDIRFTRQELQQQLDARMPITQQQQLFAITLSDPLLALLQPEQRLSIRTRIQVGTAFGYQGNGIVTLDGKLRYQRQDFSFYIDEPRITELQIDGLAPALQPQLQNLAQNLLAPALTGQPVYTLKDTDMQEALARMMLKSLRIEADAIVARLGF